VSLPLAATLAAAALALGAVLDTATPAPIAADDPRVSRVAGQWLVAGRAYTGRMVETSRDGSRVERAVRDGRRHGEERTFYANGTLRAMRHYARGAEVGVHRGWWPDGTRQFERRYAAGRPEGLARTWYASGLRFEEHRYVAGQEAGLQQLWYPDGRVRASYEIRDGRRYGSIGTKLCANEAVEEKGS
jgi:hypothetical protein